MPSARSTEPLYQRGKYRLVEREGRNHEILWYDQRARRDRSRSTGTRDLEASKDALDRLYLQREKGQAICPTCGKPWEDQRRFLLTQSMIDYDLARKSSPSYEAIHARLGHVHAYLEDTRQTAISCEEIDSEWIDNFWEWAIEVPVVLPKGRTRERAPGTVNNSVLQLAAAINFSHRRHDTIYPAAFKPKPPAEVNRTPTYRSDINELARMFDYALRYPVKRLGLLNFLRISVVTLVRPEHAHDLNADPARGMWHPREAVFNLLPRRTLQTKKRRPIVPVARQAIPWLNLTPGPLIEAESIASTWSRMQADLGLPRDGQAGPKLVRRSMSTLIRQRIGQRDVTELSLFLGHRESSAVTDLYAPFDPDYLSTVKAAIEGIVDELEALVPGAFHRIHTADGGKVFAIGGRKAP
jgi:hypothetical protein